MDDGKVGIYRYFKRVIGFVISLIALIVLSPVILIVGILVYIKLGSPIIFKQERPGKDGKIFKMYKFRTMLDSCNKFGEALPDEERLTKFGKILRSTSLDELPELINVIKGDMSLVGPRPLLVEYLELYSDEQKKRHNVRPGITGWAQVNGNIYLPWEKRLLLDSEYVDRISFMFDLRILVKTVAIVLLGEDKFIKK